MKKVWLGIVCLCIMVLAGCASSEVKKILGNVQVMQDNKHHIEALATIDEALITYPHNKKLLAHKGELLIASEQYEHYLILRPKLDEKSQSIQQRSFLLAQIRSGNPALALESIDTLIDQTPTSDLRQLKGQALYLQGNLEDAEAAYDQALLLDPSNQKAIVNKAITLADNGKLYDSLNLLDQALSNNPDDYLLWYNKGTVLSDLGYQQRNVAGTGSFSFYSDALRHFEKSYRLNSDYQNTAIWLGITYLDLGQYTKALQALETTVSSDPNAYDARYYIGKTYTAQKEWQKAKETYEHLITINPTFELATQELVLLDKELQKNEEYTITE